MKTLTLVAASFAMLAITSQAAAQERWAFEGRVGAAFPTQDIGSDELGTGVAFEGTFHYRFAPHLGAYAGWGWTMFNAETSFAGADMDFEETGYSFGLRFEHPFTDDAPLAGWIRAGGTYDHIEIEDDEGDIVADSDHGLGFEVAGGVAMSLGSRWSLTPGLRYSSLSHDIEIGSATTEMDLQYLALEVGLAWRF
jgi:opacity protein-like surface antigen